MFSELVDSCIKRSGRGDKMLDIIDYLNATVREVQSKGLFYKDMVEDKLSLTQSDPFIWTPPKPLFRQLRTVQYPDLSFPPLKKPGRVQGLNYAPSMNSYDLGEKYYYAASNYIVFARCGTLQTAGGDGFTNSYIGVAYYTWLPRLAYYSPGHRPATYNDEDANLLQEDVSLLGDNYGWEFFNLTTDSDATTVNIRKDWTAPQYQPPTADPATALRLVTNWVLDDWREMVKEGALAKLYKAIGDQTRASTSYILYSQMRTDLLATELQESVEK